MPVFQDHEIVELRNGDSLVRIAPQFGARLLSWHSNGESIIHWPEEADWSKIAGLRGGNPILFPFIARHRVDGVIGRWRDDAGVVRDVPMHGFARDLPFSAEQLDGGTGLRMTLVDTPATRAGYPFGFRFEVVYRLIDASTLEVEFVTANTGDSRMPYYAGHHFYFTLPHVQRSVSTLEVPATHYRHQSADGKMSDAAIGDVEYRFDDPDIVDRFHCLGAVTERPVRIVMPELQRTIEIDLQRPGSAPWYAVTSWTENEQSDFYCVEPWLGLPDAIHHRLGLRWLEPGEVEIASLRVRVIPHAAR
ncbi:aldose epimerase family protein [Paraburkholderia adhaesiva]|uniref:aldose epimerase family protein n=1 Tax=Paraburkholderia adhaesiva TaxID=2883244 RepID=UPI001F1635F8|nr:aldose epimerase [Paraburkholderia adhaesiva]